MKKLVCLLLVVAMILSLAACAGDNNATTDTTDTTTDTTNTTTEPSGDSDDTASSGDTIKIGVCANYSSIAISFFAPGLYYAINEINAAGGIDGKQVEWVYRDTQGDASNLTQKLNELKDEGVVAIVGPDSDAMAPAAAKWAEANQIVLVSPSTMSTTVALEAHSDYFFTAGLNAWAIINAINSDISDKNYENYVVIGTDGGSSDDFIKLSAQTFDAEQSKTVQVTTGTTDLSSVVMSLMGDDPDFSISSISATTWTSFFAQASQLGMYDEIMNYGWEFIDSLYTEIGEDYPAGHFRGVLGWPHCIQDTEEQQAMTAAFLQIAQDEFDMTASPGAQMMMWYIAGQSIIEALKIAGADCTTDALIDALENIDFATPWADSISYRAMDHALVMPYTFATAVWDDQEAGTVKLEDVIVMDANELLPSYEDYQSYAETYGLPFDWVKE